MLNPNVKPREQIQQLSLQANDALAQLATIYLQLQAQRRFADADRAYEVMSSIHNYADHLTDSLSDLAFAEHAD
jgi:hypothetical protein